ncbi:hypothetical protein DFJ73DRAFT_775619 [Zopfochytrium polystomum]|nr:hypothetical protein DFJ73DRAFT_775619 [Zopfochytrium polystomum]
MRLPRAAVLAAFAAAAVFGAAPSQAAPAPVSSDDTSPASPLLLSSSSSTSSVSTGAFVSGLVRRIIEPVSASIAATGAVIAGVQAGKAVVEAHDRNRKVAQKSLQEGYKAEFERDKEKTDRRINHFEEHPSQGCYSVCGGKKTYSPANCSTKKFRSAVTVFRRALDLLTGEDDDVYYDYDDGAASAFFDDDEADDADADAYGDDDAFADAASDIYAGELARRAPPPAGKPKLQRANSLPARLPSSGGGGGKKKAAPNLNKPLPAVPKGAPKAAPKAKGKPAESKKTKGAGGKWNPFARKPTSPDEIKHVKKKVDEHVGKGGCAVVHNKLSGQY